jgi:UDP-GlcNAc:undecaprenyl-phosphate/decaprenyl-phosphate GlcNAc-1-phosphate transferase
MMPTAIASFVSAGAVSLALTALIWRIAPRLGLIDRPDQRRKLHGLPIPLGGGAAVFLATVAVLGALVFTPNPWRLQINEQWWNLLGSFLACAWIVVLGLIDDRVGIRGRQKLLGQIVAASILMSCGVLIRKIGLFGWEADLGPLAIPVTLFWLVGAMNAVNLLDGMDGLATVLGIILSISICVLAAMTHHAAVAIAAVVFAGSLLGFLPFNLAPAKVYLGDAGSMLIGLVVGALSIRATLKGPGTVLLAAPLAILTIPILDSAVAILRRKLAGRSIYETDRGHIHHRLLAKFGSKHKVLLCVIVCSVVTCAGALASTYTKSDSIALVAVAAVVAMFVATGLFGRGEFVLLAARVRNLVLSLARPAVGRRLRSRETTARLQGSRQWDVLWESLTESAEKLGLTKIQLDVNMPALQEGYSGVWESPVPEDRDNQWELKLPLLVAGHGVGSLTIVGEHDGDSGCPSIELVREILHPFEVSLRELAEKDILAMAGDRRPPLDRHSRKARRVAPAGEQ